MPAGSIHHFGSLAEEEIETRPGYSVTTPLRTLIDVARSALSQEHLDAAVKEALECGMVRRSVLGSVRREPAARMRLDRALASLRTRGDHIMIGPYYAPFAIRMALEERPRDISQREGIDLLRLRRRVAFERLLARLSAEAEPPWYKQQVLEGARTHTV